MSRNKGFTLIELLVVIAIIAILAAILFPVFAQARAKARQTTCISNQKQIGLAFVQYTSDFDDYAPFAQQNSADPAGLRTNGYGIFDGLRGYLKGTAILYCPSRNPQGADYIGQWSAAGVVFGNGMNYIVNSSVWPCGPDWDTAGVWGCAYDAQYGDNYINDDPAQGLIPAGTLAFVPGQVGKCMSEIASPANVISTSESGEGGYMMGGELYFWSGATFGVKLGDGPNAGQYFPDCGLPLHGTGMVFSFADGHAKWYDMSNHPGSKMSDGGSPQDPSSWYPTPVGYYTNGCYDWPENKISIRYNYTP